MARELGPDAVEPGRHRARRKPGDLGDVLPGLALEPQQDELRVERGEAADQLGDPVERMRIGDLRFGSMLDEEFVDLVDRDPGGLAGWRSARATCAGACPSARAPTWRRLARA